MFEFLLKLTHKKPCKKDKPCCEQKQEQIPAENQVKIPEEIVAKIDYEKLANAIVEANERIEKKKKEKEQEEYKQQKENWQIALLGKKLEEGEDTTFWNVLFRITKIKKENISNTNAIYSLLKMCNDLLLCGYKWLFYILSLISAVLFGFKTFDNFCSQNCIYGIINFVLCIVITVFLFFISQVIRVARLEAEICDKKEMVEKIFNFLTSFTAMLFAIIAVVISIITMIITSNGGCSCI